MNKLRLAVVTVWVFIACGLVAADESSPMTQLKYFKAVDGSGGKTGLAGIEFGSEIYASTEMHFPDIRLFAADGTVIPYFIRQVSGKKQVEQSIACDSRIIKFTKLPDNAVEVVVERLNRKLKPMTITVVTPVRNFEKRITVSGSDDLSKNWKTLKTDAEIFNYFGIIRLEQTTISIPASDFRYYKLLISNFTGEKVSPFRSLKTSRTAGSTTNVVEETTLVTEPLEITDIKLATVEKREVYEKAITRKYPVEQVKREENKDKQTVITLKSSLEPLTSLTVRSSSPNYFRRMNIKWSKDGEKWQYLGFTNEILKITSGETITKGEKVTFNEIRAPYYQVVINNGDSPPLENITVEAEGNVYRLEAFASGVSTGAKLFYGGTLRAPNYDTAQVISRMKSPAITLLSLGPQQANPDYKPASPEPNKGAYKVLFYVIIGIVAVVLLVIIAVSFRKIEMIADE